MGTTSARLLYVKEDTEQANKIKQMLGAFLQFTDNGAPVSADDSGAGLAAIAQLIIVSGSAAKARLALVILSRKALGNSFFLTEFEQLKTTGIPLILFLKDKFTAAEQTWGYPAIDGSDPNLQQRIITELVQLADKSGSASTNTGGGFQDFTKGGGGLIDLTKSGGISTGGKLGSVGASAGAALDDLFNSGQESNHNILINKALENLAINRSINTDKQADNNFSGLEKFFPEILNKDLADAADANSQEKKGSHAKPPEHPSRGKILYDIPDQMQLNNQQKCQIRIGKDEEMIKAGGHFTAAVVLDDITLTGMMKAEIIDIAEPPCFSIKTISTPVQEVNEEDFTEWIFYVKPLAVGHSKLVLKISAIKNEEGREKIRDIVYEKEIMITSDAPQGPGLLLGNTFAATATTTQEPAPLKNLMQEDGIKQFSSPNVFISYAHDDQPYFEIFEHNLRNQSGWNIWTDRNIQVGANWFEQIQQSMAHSDLAILLVSGAFFSSVFIKEHEFAKFKQLKEEYPPVIILPVLLRDTDISRWTDLAEMQFFSTHCNEYDVPGDPKALMPFALLCQFNKRNGELIPNPYIDTYFRNFVQKVQGDWLRNQLAAAS